MEYAAVKKKWEWFLEYIIKLKKQDAKVAYVVCYLLCKKEGEIGKHSCISWFLQKERKKTHEEEK